VLPTRGDEDGLSERSRKHLQLYCAAMLLMLRPLIAPSLAVHSIILWLKGALMPGNHDNC
jgi:hypothetical protein